MQMPLHGEARTSFMPHYPPIKVKGVPDVFPNNIPTLSLCRLHLHGVEHGLGLCPYVNRSLPETQRSSYAVESRQKREANV